MPRGALRYPVLLHGFTGSSASWGSVIVDGLTGVGRPPVLVDLPGHGRRAARPDQVGDAVAAFRGGPGAGERTGPAVITLDEALAAIGRAASDGAGDGPVDLVGYSMGGRLALHFAAAHPERVRCLVLESASPGLATEAERAARRAADEDLAALLLTRGIEPFVERWEAQPLFESRTSVDPTEIDRQRDLRLRNDPAKLAAALRGLGTGALPSLWGRLGALRPPVLLIVGSLDRKFVDIAKRMGDALHDARVVEVPGAGHTVHLERPKEWLAAVTSFLGEV